MKRKIMCLGICLLFITITQLATAEIVKDNTPLSTGYGYGKIFGIVLEETDDQFTIYLLLPLMGRGVLDKDRFAGRIGFLFAYGLYRWWANGPPALP